VRRREFDHQARDGATGMFTRFDHGFAKHPRV
jgi:hypothetical protein